MNNIKYIWSQQDGGEMHGLFNSIQEAVTDAQNYAKTWKTPMSVYVFDARPATEEDRFYFEGEDEQTGEVVDFTPNWFEGCYVPENVVEKLFVA